MSKDVAISRRPDGKFTMKHGNVTGDSEQTYPVLHFPQGSGPQLIVFKLPSGPERFSLADPIWVSETAKPQKPMEHDQIIDAHVFDAGKTLVVLNKNSKEADLYYNLNMVTGAGVSISLDPEIKNGGEGFWGTETLALIIGAAVVMLLVGLWAGRLTAKR